MNLNHDIIMTYKIWLYEAHNLHQHILNKSKKKPKLISILAHCHLQYQFSKLH